MRICIATSSYPRERENSSAGVFVQNFARTLVKQGVYVSIFSQDTGHLPQRDRGIEVATFSWPGKGIPLSTLKPYHPLDAIRMLFLLQRGSNQLIAHCRQKKIDFLLAMWAVPAGHWGMNVQKSLGIPFAVWCLGSDIWVYGRLPIFKLWVRKILKRSSYCFADGSSLANEVKALSGRPCSFLATTRILPQERLPELLFDPEMIHYVFIGRYHRNKGPDLLLDAIRLIDREALSQMQFHFFGMGSLEGDLKRRVIRYGLEKNVSIQGPVDEDTLTALLRRCHALIIPSRIESIPIILSDALQVDCSLIVTDVGDMGPLVRSHEAGIVAAKNSPEALKEAILDQLKRGKEAYREGRQKLYSLFDLKGSAKTFLQTIGKDG